VFQDGKMKLGIDLLLIIQSTNTLINARNVFISICLLIKLIRKIPVGGVGKNTTNAVLEMKEWDCVGVRNVETNRVKRRG
jgi:hypothetical protein